MIKLQVIGHLGRDAALNNVNGRNVINFAVAHTEKYKDAQGVQKEKTTWVDCAYWTDRTAIVPYLKKGNQIYVEGIPDAVPYMKKQPIEAAAKIVLRVSNIQLLNTKDHTDTTSQTNAVTAPPVQHAAPTPSTPTSGFGFPQGQAILSEDDLPF